MGVKHSAIIYEPVSRVWPGMKAGCEQKSATSAMSSASLGMDAENQDLLSALSEKPIQDLFSLWWDCQLAFRTDSLDDGFVTEINITTPICTCLSPLGPIKMLII